MAPFIQNISLSDVSWRKLHPKYMWNDVYYLRRTKMGVYQTTTSIAGGLSALAVVLMRQYNDLQNKEVPVPDYPGAKMDTNNLVSFMPFFIFACSFVSLVFSIALMFDLFWPERKESQTIQWMWKLSSIAASVFALSACLATLVVVICDRVLITGVSEDELHLIHKSWAGPALVYSHDIKALAIMSICLIEFGLATYSTGVMWKAYEHNEVHGPFNDNR